MKTVCAENQCSGCMACIEACNHNAIVIRDDLRFYNAVIDPGKCIGCGACYRVCPNNRPISAILPIAWYQGWMNAKEDRALSSSGGFAAAIAYRFIKLGGIVCSCIFTNGEFKFAFSKKSEDIRNFVGSKYVKSNPSGIYREIVKLLVDEQKVLFIGLPCQAAAVKAFVGDTYSKRLYLVDLICHGTPSPRNFDQFLREAGYALQSVSNVSFRKKNRFYTNVNGKNIDAPGVYDCYTLAFLNGINYTENCYVCPYAKRERVSDITIGDSWGSNLSVEEQKKGISLALCQTEKGEQLLKEADIQLYPVELETAIEHNRQLEGPSAKPKRYDRFFSLLLSGRSYHEAVKKVLPRTYRNQQIKRILNKFLTPRGE